MNADKSNKPASIRVHLQLKVLWLQLEAAFFLLLLCSCATKKPTPPPPVQSQLPPEIVMNEDAGRGGWVIVNVQLEGGRELPFIVDTGASGTLFDKSLAPLLHKRPGSVTLRMWGARERAELYDAPRLFLGGVPLRTGRVVATHDFKQFTAMAGRPVLGCLGMDCLRHYCIQLDFSTDKMRFLDDTHASPDQWGKPIPLSALGWRDARPCVSGNLLGAKDGYSQIDTGDHGDGWLRPNFFQQWTDVLKVPPAGEARSPEGILNGETYRQISLREANAPSDGIGLHFLSRHLVTLDFPNWKMYLKRTSIGPLPDKGFATVMDFLKDLKEEGRLPGWSEDDHGELDGAAMDPDLTSGTVAFRKNGHPSLFHYTVTRASKESPWRLQKAWQTDPDDRLIQTYAVPIP